MKIGSDLQQADPCLSGCMRDHRDRRCATEHGQRMPASLLGSQPVVRSFVGLLTLCSTDPSKSTEKPTPKDYRHSDVGVDTTFGDYNIHDGQILLLKWVRVSSSWVTLIILGITKCRSPAFVSQHFSLAFECPLTCQWSVFILSAFKL